MINLPFLLKLGESYWQCLVEVIDQNIVQDRPEIYDGVIDTTTASGELVFNIFSSLAQFERRLIQERTRAGLKAARARGKKGGRKPITADDPRVKMAKRLNEDKSLAINDICKQMQISRTTFYRLLNVAEAAEKKAEAVN